MGSRLEKQSNLIRKQLEHHTFDDEHGEEYDASRFGGFSDYFRRKRLKLQNVDTEIRSKSIDKPQIFRGMVVHVNGYTQPSLNDIHHLVASHGGFFLQYLDGKTTVTHIIAANLTPKKAIEFQNYRIVKPAWIVDSVAAGKVLPWTAYKVLQEGPAQRRLDFHGDKLVCPIKSNPRSYRDQTNNSWYTTHVKNFVNHINKDIRPNSPILRTVEKDILGTHTADNTKRETCEAFTNKSRNCSHSSLSFKTISTLEEILDSAEKSNSFSELESIFNSATIAENNVKTPFPHESNSQHKSKLDDANLITYNCPHQKTTVSGIQDNSLGIQIQRPKVKPKKITAEEHNYHLRADPDVRKSTTANPEFIPQFFSESRLHHLSAWKAELKSRLQKITVQKSTLSDKLLIKRSGLRRYILHVDFDSFFCAVSLKNNPEWIGKPAAVAHSGGPGAEIASCNYPARAFGIKNGMWMKNALKLCPQIKVLPYDFPAYEAVCNQFYEVLLNVGGIIQSVSVDEALIDVTSMCHVPDEANNVMMDDNNDGDDKFLLEQERADAIASKLRQQIKEKTGCEVSVGIGPNILLARVALRRAKPAGQFQLKPKEALEYIDRLSVRDLPGVAHSIGGKLEENGVKLVKDVRQLLTKERLMKLIGPRIGEKIWNYSHGIDDTEVGEQAHRKSVSAEVNWGIRFISQQEAEDFVQNLCVELQRRLVDQKVRGRQLTMKIMKRSAGAPLDPPKHLGHGICDTFSRSIIFGIATNRAQVIGREALSILRSYGFSPGELRGLGVQMTKLEPVRATIDVDLDGSQLRIDYMKSTSKSGRRSRDDPIDDETEKPDNYSGFSSTTFNKNKIGSDERIGKLSMAFRKTKCSTQFLNDQDPIDEDIQQKLSATNKNAHPASAILRLNSSDPMFSPKPLNITGTQFIIPSQIDPNVLQELPSDLRTRLVAQSKIKETPKNDALTSVKPPITKSPNFQDYNSQLPSQLDLDVFYALPEDLKTEVLATCKTGNFNKLNQPAVPRKARKLPEPLSKIPLRRRKHGRGRPFGIRSIHDPRQLSFLTFSNRVQAENSSVETANIKAKKESGPDGAKAEPKHGSENFSIDEDFLSALPEDVKDELLAEQKRRQWNLAQSSLFKCTGPPIKNKKSIEQGSPMAPRRIVLPKRAARPTFTTQELSSLSQLRETTSAWYEEFAREGPYSEDVSALNRYLRRVVIEERDLAKAFGVVRWLEYLVNPVGQNESAGTNTWLSALDNIKTGVQSAVQERGLGRIDFS